MWVVSLLAACQPPEHAGTEAGPAVVCQAPDARAAQTYDEERVAGDDASSGTGLLHAAKGAVVLDFDGDGLDDLFVPRYGDPSQFFLGAGDRFVPAPERLDTAVLGAAGASAADVDGDGDRDLFVYRRELPPVLFRNDDGWLVSVPFPLPEALSSGCGGSAAFGDYDLDGDLDLFYGRLDQDAHQTPCDSALLANDGKGAFTVVADALSPDVQADRVMAAAWLPLDADPWPELYVVSDLPSLMPGNRVLDNDAGVLKPLPTHPLHISIAGMGVAVADLNDDGIVDVFVPGVAEFALLVGVAGGQWADATEAWGLFPDATREQETAWGGALQDFDNDGREDLAVAFGPNGERNAAEFPRQPDELYRQTGPGEWVAVAEAWGLDDDRSNRSIVVADLDGNGFLDQIRPGLGTATLVSRGRCDASAWLTIHLHQDGGNPDGVGARVVVRDGTERWWRIATAGGTGFASGDPPSLHFGLGMRDTVEDIEVTWPDGEVESFGPAATRRKLDLWRDAPFD